ncbi:EF-hand domain-containing protein [Meridianimarinicoccus sp. MJW13]|uniref:EF-hand domain-containing protein n=1 Tax=Meridianimarinicoccus sp. MJW13 TaxID=2720031 RepID=UPI0018690444|nr:EF-hand domain-containing protein [Fluviibacterium sp. MJW13]
MKKTTAVLALTALVALPMAATPVLAKGGKGPEMTFETMDLNGDGGITVEELTGQRVARFTAADANGDGVLSVEEMQAAAEAEFQQRMGARMEQMIERLDANGDGAISLEEFEAVGGRKADRGARMIDKLDANDDGVVDAEEFAAHSGKRDGKGSRGKHGHGQEHGGFWR